MKKIITKNRKIINEIPDKKSINFYKELTKLEPRGMHGQFPIVWKKAKNFNVYDFSGNKFIDFSSTILVANIGHSNANLISDVMKLLKKPLLHSYNYATEERFKYTKNLLNFIPRYLNKAFLLSSGSEATEAVIKLFRYYGKKEKKRKNIIISFEGNWHGRTLGSEMMGGKQKLKQWIVNKDKDIIQLPFPYPWTKKGNLKNFFNKVFLKALKNKKINVSTDISGIILESFQGWGTIFYPINFVKELEKFCRKKKILLAFDEIQAGFGRTGKLFGYMHYNVKPDLVCCGKGAGSGFPLSIVLGNKKILDLPDVGEMSSTHSANPLACIFGNATINEIRNKKLINKSYEKGKLFSKKLVELKKQFPKIIKYIFCKGLVASIIFKNDSQTIKKVNKIANNCFENGLIVIKTGRESIKLAPPLCITNSALNEGIDIITHAIEKNM
jgi:4-aminobutyrate aminotransferase-like enzyme